MSEIKRILVASDMSERATRAETRAAKLCQRFGLSELELVNVQDTGFVDTLAHLLEGHRQKSEELVIEQIKKDFEPTRKRIFDTFGINTSLTVLFGRPAVEIAKYADANDVSLVVAGTGTPGIGRQFFLGRTSDRLLHVTSVPLLIVRQIPEGPYRNVLIPIDFSENSLYAARFASKVVLPASRRTFLHAYDVPNEGLMRYASVSADLISKFRMEAKSRAENDMAGLMASLDSQNRVSHVVRYGNPLRVIEDYVNTNNPDLIIMGKQGRSYFENLLLGSVTRSTVNETSCDILVVPLKPKSATAAQ